MTATIILKEDCALYRRAAFLLDEAKHREKRDQAITFTMRALSNYATIGKDAGSSKIKDENTRVSSAAMELIGRIKSLRDWHKQTINEHPLPLKAIWSRILEDAPDLTPFDVWSIFVDNPMITITKHEDSQLSKSGCRSTASADRYSEVGIIPVVLKDSPKRLIQDRLQGSH